MQLKETNPNFQSLSQSLAEFYLNVQKIIHQLSDENEFSFETLRERLEAKLFMGTFEILLIVIAIVSIIFVGNYGKDTQLGYTGTVLLAISAHL